MGDLIGSGFEPHTSRTRSQEADILPLILPANIRRQLFAGNKIALPKELFC